MATVTGFESLPYPGKSELRQFAELFSPLFAASSDEAKRQAVAALSQSPNVPQAVALFIASQPISIAAPFLASSPCLTDDLLILIARTQGLSHARAIVRRESLSPRVIDALVDLRHEKRVEIEADASLAESVLPPRQAVASTPDAAAGDPAATVAAPTDAAPDAQRAAREEELRQKIRALAAHVRRPPSDRLGLRTVTPIQEALMVRFARAREGGPFATALANALSSSRWLAERILLDISGRQLAVTLTGLDMNIGDAAYVLGRLYPQLSQAEGAGTRAMALLAALDPVECEERIDAWIKADRYTYPAEGDEAKAPYPAAANGPSTPAETIPALPRAPASGHPWPRDRIRLRGRR